MEVPVSQIEIIHAFSFGEEEPTAKEMDPGVTTFLYLEKNAADPEEDSQEPLTL